MFTKYFEGVSMKFQVNFQGVSKKFYVAWPSSQLPEQKEGLYFTNDKIFSCEARVRRLRLPSHNPSVP